MDVVITDINQINRTNIYDASVSDWLFGFDDDDEPIMPDDERIRNIAKLKQMAAEWSMKGAVTKYLNELEKKFNSLRSQAKKDKILSNGGNKQHFGEHCKYPSLNIGTWYCDLTGIKYINDKGAITLISYTPATIVGIYRNIETGDEKVRIAFLKSGRWIEISADKADIASSNKITKLSARGMNITSENAKLMVRYFSDLEGLNCFCTIKSTSKLGWHTVKGDLKFLPYDKDIVFDADDRFKNLIDSIHESGSFEKWQEAVCETLSFGRIEPRLLLAASFASVLVEVTGSLPFIVHLFGESGSGKTVSIMLASSVWANPSSGSGFSGDWLTTLTAIEARENTLSNIPMIMDDSSKTQKKFQDDFTEAIYLIANGTGKERSNQNIGLRVSNSWRNCMLSTGEHPLIGEHEQGGAVNRVVEIRADSGDLFKNPKKIVSIISENYGHAGKIFVDAVKGNVEEVNKRFNSAYNQCVEFGATSKQAMAIACIMTADFFCLENNIYGCNVPMLTARHFKGFMKSLTDVSENERCHNWLSDQIVINKPKFTGNDREIWGHIPEYSNEVQFVKSALEKLLNSEGFDCKTYIEWLKSKGLLRHGKNDYIQSKFPDGSRPRCYAITFDCVEFGDDVLN